MQFENFTKITDGVGSLLYRRDADGTRDDNRTITISKEIVLLVVMSKARRDNYDNDDKAITVTHANDTVIEVTDNR